MRWQLLTFTAIPLASVAASLFSPRVGMYLYLLLAIPAFVTDKIDRMIRAAAPGKHP